MPLGAAPAAEPEPWQTFRPLSTRDHIAVRAASTDMDRWLHHIAPAAACTRPIRLAGYRAEVEASTGRILSSYDTAAMPDGVIYKACGSRLASVCPSCSRLYQQDAFQLLRAGLVGGKGIPETVASHPAVFATFTAPSFGTVHTRVVRKHTCARRSRCDCRAEPCHARTGPRDPRTCEHDTSAVCFARHESGDRRIGKPLCLDCYDHNAHVMWNSFSGELWRRTKQAADRHLAAVARERGIARVVIGYTPANKPRTVPAVRLTHGKAAEFQARGSVHFHVLVRLDGVATLNPTAVVPPPPGFTADDIVTALQHASAIAFVTPAHPDQPEGWPIAWGPQLDLRPLNLSGNDPITDGQVAGYLSKYATKGSEPAGHASARITDQTIDAYADPAGDHIDRLIAACWHLGRPTTEPDTYDRLPPPWRATRLRPPWTCPECGHNTRLTVCVRCHPSSQALLDTQRAQYEPPDEDNPYSKLRRWAHLLGFGGHCFTTARRYSTTFTALRNARRDYHRTPTPVEPIRTADHTDEETILIVGGLTYAGIGWHNTGDAILANTSAAMARARREAARDALTNH
ncbi:replication initiator [Hamadaea tsunoensis]